MQLNNDLTFSPKEAIIAVTLQCNSRCLMCKIWQNRTKNEISPKIFFKLPPSLEEINITGGEPFLRNDLPIIIKNIRKTCPKARLLINTNGYLVSQINKLAPLIFKSDPQIAIRVSLDGTKKIHDKIRNLPNYFEKAIKSLSLFRKIGIKDLGISFTLIDINKSYLLKMYSFCKKNNYDFSLTIATDSPIYFGKNKMLMRPKANSRLNSIFLKLRNNLYRSTKIKNWIRAWFTYELFNYMQTSKRKLSCTAGSDFFYMDSYANIYTCNIKPWKIGNLIKQNCKQIFYKNVYYNRTCSNVLRCNDCWMICSARTSMKNNIVKIIIEVLIGKLRSFF